MNAPFWVSDWVRWSDTDPAGIIHYGAYIRFFELAETELFRGVGLPLREILTRHDVTFPRRVLHAEFLAPVSYDEQLWIATYFSRVGRTSLTIHFDAWNESRTRLHAAAHQVVVCVAPERLVPVAIPEEITSAVRKFRMTVEEARASVESRT